jgi:single-stranded-DNA-specific exonuclease
MVDCRPDVLPTRPPRRWLLPRPLPPLPEPWPLPLPGPLITVLRRRGFRTAAAIEAILDPPPAEDAAGHFPGLEPAVARLLQACRRGERVGICGDYDADGMTSTALLVRTLGDLGAGTVPSIPSRAEEGYGLNAAMVERLAGEQGVTLIVTVDNGVSAAAGLARCRQLGCEVILTDHHTLPDPPPDALALIHPATTPAGSPYRGLAGVGLAFVLARQLCLAAGRTDTLATARDLYCIGTIADMAPLTGVNRRWLLDGLPRLRHSRLAGLQALMRVAGLEESGIGATEVGFRLAPRLNAVGRLGDPLQAVALLTSEDEEETMARARDCEQLNRERRELCDAIEAEALALVEAEGDTLPAVLVVAQPHWHHGVIGIVAARLVDRFGRPVALLASEGSGRLRASMRAPEGFAVDRALAGAADLLERFGGHPAAGGFTVRAERVSALAERLQEAGQAWLRQAGPGVPVTPEVRVSLAELDRDFWQACRRLEPFGVGHPQPLFWSPRCQVLEQRSVRGGHLQLRLGQHGTERQGIAWRWDGPLPLPATVDVAFRLTMNRFREQERLQLEIVDLRESGGGVVLQRRQRRYWCHHDGRRLHVRNDRGQIVSRSCLDGRLQPPEAGEPHHPYIEGLLQDAVTALGLVA